MRGREPQTSFEVLAENFSGEAGADVDPSTARRNEIGPTELGAHVNDIVKASLRRHR